MKVGASYYPEVLDRAEWERDLAVGREIGLSCLRCGEFAWSSLSPTEEEWDIEWAKSFLDLAHQYGYAVIWCTPSATPPPYLFDRWPDLHAVGSNGQVMPLGIRRHYCPSHDGYRELCANTAARLADDLADHPATAGWQVDNELAGDYFTCWCPRCGRNFHRWLEERYQTLDRLNDAWQTGVWSQRYTAWSQVPVPLGSFTYTPSLRLAYRRFRSDNWLAFYRLQADALRKSGARQVTTNFYNLTWDIPFDHWAWRPHLDTVGISHYLEDEIASRFQLAELRGANPGDKPLWVLEQKAGQQCAQNLFPEDLLRLTDHLQRCAEAGADYAIYWHLRQHSAGPEMEHGAVLRHDGKPTRIARAVQQTIIATADIQATQPDPRALLVFSFEQQWAVENRPPAAGRWDYRTEVQENWYAAARAVLGEVCLGSLDDIADRHALILLPFAQVREPGLADTLRDCLQRGATVITTADLGRLDMENNVLREPPLSILRGLAPIPELEVLHLTEGTAIPGTLDGHALHGRLFWAVPDDGVGNNGFGEFEYADHRGPAVLRYSVGQGTLLIALSALGVGGVTALLNMAVAHSINN